MARIREPQRVFQSLLFAGAAVAVILCSSGTASAQPQCPSLVLNGSGFAAADHTIFPNSATIANFTVEAWFYPTAMPALNATMVIVADDAYDIRITNTNGRLVLAARYYSQTGQTGALGTIFNLGDVFVNQWTHVAMGYNGSVSAPLSKGVIYVNGVKTDLEGTFNLSNFGVFSSNFTIGASPDGTNAFSGFIDDVRVSDSAKYSGNFVPPSSLSVDGSTRALFRFSEAAGATTFADASPNAHTLIGSGGAQTASSPTFGCGATLSTQPRSQSINPGDTAILSVRSIGGDPSTYQWYVGPSPNTSNPIAGATLADYTTPALAVTTPYWVRVVNSFGSVASSTATVTVAPAGAAFTVNSTLDAVDASPGDGMCATSGAVCTLRAAVQESNALGGSHVITLPAGTYTLSGASGETAAATGDLNVSSFIRINGASATTTIIDGGAVDRVFQAASGALTLVDLTVRNGLLGNSYGGCVHVEGVNLTLMRVTVTSCKANYSGGGIYAWGPLTVIATDSVITQNTSGDGGGFYGNTITATLTGTSISSNRSIETALSPSVFIPRIGRGAGLALFGVSTAQLIGDTVALNISDKSGGGLYVGSTQVTGGVATITNSTIANNQGPGHGIYASTFSTVGLINDTISGPLSPFALGPSVVASGTIQVRNTVILAETSDTTTCSLVGSGVITDQGNNLEFPGTACVFSLASDVRVDPLLGALGNNGGLTMTRALGVGSPALNAGNDAACAAAPVSGVDQRGRVRPKGPHCDIGAVESGAGLAFTDNALTAGTTTMKAVHVTELRSRIDAVRLLYGLSASTWTNASVSAGSTTIKAVHITEMREALRQAYVAAGITAPTYTDPNLTAGMAVKAVHIAELRAAVLGIE